MIKWLDASSLQTVKESRITTEILPEIKHYLEKFPENIYVKNDNDGLNGIMTVGDVKKGIEFGAVRINKDFSKLIQRECNQDRINLFFASHRSIRCVPVVNDKGKLIGEYRNIYANIDITEIDPLTFRNEILEYLKHRAIGKVYISNFSNGEVLEEFISQQSRVKITGIDDADICILSDADFRDIMWKNISAGKVMKQNVISLKEFMLKCVIRYCFKKFSEQNVDTLVVCAPTPDHIETLTEDEKRWISESKRPEELIDKDDVLKTIYGENESILYLKSGEYKASFIKRGHHCALEDVRGKYMNVLDGKRVTAHIPEKYSRKVYFFGSCIARGAFVSDEYTIESFLQERLNESYPDTFSCINCGVAGAVGNEYNDFLYMLDTKFCEGDIVIIAAEYSKEIMDVIMECNVSVLETSSLFEHPHDYGRWFLDSPIHMNHIANKVIADKIFSVFTEIWDKNIDTRDKSFFAMLESDKVEIPQELREYLLGVTRKMRGGIARGASCWRGRYELQSVYQWSSISN